MIVEEAVREVRRLCSHELAGVGVERIAVGLYFTLVQLTGGACGLAMTEAENELAGLVDRPRQTGRYAPGALTRLSLPELLEVPGERPVLNSVRWALLNACSTHMERLWQRPVIRDRNILDLIDCSPGMRICMVGAFQSLLDRLTLLPCEVRVLELRPEMIPDRYRHLHVSGRQGQKVLQTSDAVIITGSSLVNDTLDGMLLKIRPGAPVALIGPSAGLFPDLLFRHGITLIGTIHITDPDRAFGIISEGGSGYHLFAECAEKIVIVHEAAG